MCYNIWNCNKMRYKYLIISHLLIRHTKYNFNIIQFFQNIDFFLISFLSALGVICPFVSSFSKKISTNLFRGLMYIFFVLIYYSKPFYRLKSNVCLFKYKSDLALQLIEKCEQKMFITLFYTIFLNKNNKI